ncbi:MAG: hypothetical protein LUC90_03040, partial [Lachnospiraceae bacterium]|nr:hypothetical protein [Lachnospiraceae bacterium]
MIAILSNINTDYVLRLVSKEYETVPAEGYGDIWGRILDRNSVFHKYDPETVFFVIDIEQLLNAQTVNEKSVNGLSVNDLSVNEQ